MKWDNSKKTLQNHKIWDKFLQAVVDQQLPQFYTQMKGITSFSAPPNQSYNIFDGISAHQEYVIKINFLIEPIIITDK